VIAGICHVKNEIDIVELVIRHTLAEGVDRIFIEDHASTDGTWELLQSMAEAGYVHLFRDERPDFDQPARMNWLAWVAREHGADWIVPFDADEFFYAPSGRTVAAELALVSPATVKLFCGSWRYLDFRRSEIAPQRPKVVFRPSPEARLVAGNHDVNLPAGVQGILRVAHYQYRSLEQFIRKVSGLEAYQSLFPVQGRPPWLDLTDEELAVEWDKLCAVETVVDPIPLRVPLEAR
jgi:hypothetical protein